LVSNKPIRLKKKPVTAKGHAIDPFKKAYEELKPQPSKGYWFVFGNKDIKSQQFGLPLNPNYYTEAKAQVKSFNPEIFIELTKMFFNKLRLHIGNTHVSEYLTYHFKKVDDQDKSKFIDWIANSSGYIESNSGFKIGNKNETAFWNWIENKREQLKATLIPVKTANIREPEVKYNITYPKLSSLFIKKEHFFTEFLKILELDDKIEKNNPKKDGKEYSWNKQHGANKEMAYVAKSLLDKNIIKHCNSKKLAQSFLNEFYFECKNFPSFIKPFQESSINKPGFFKIADSNFTQLKKWLDNIDSSGKF